MVTWKSPLSNNCTRGSTKGFGGHIDHTHAPDPDSSEVQLHVAVREGVIAALVDDHIRLFRRLLPNEEAYHWRQGTRPGLYDCDHNPVDRPAACLRPPDVQGWLLENDLVVLVGPRGCRCSVIGCDSETVDQLELGVLLKETLLG
jgi:hypothetical protein